MKEVLSSNAERTWRKRERSEAFACRWQSRILIKARNRFAWLAICHPKMELRTYRKTFGQVLSGNLFEWAK
jgi:hypothetical protein